MPQHYETAPSTTGAGNQNRPSTDDRISDDATTHPDSDVTGWIAEHDPKRVSGEPRFGGGRLGFTSGIKAERIEINVERSIIRR